MPSIKLYPYQEVALNKMKNGCILNGSVGTGKSCVSLAYVFTRELNGSIKPWKDPEVKKDIYIITTAKKRDSREWEMECARFDLTKYVKVTIDSWNNIKKYKDIYGSVFIFDEDRVVGKGAWVKAFLKITRKNRWILLSATPGDTYSDYVPIFIANGFYKNRTEFNSKHIIFKPYMPYPVIDHYVGTGLLEKYRRSLLVPMEPPRRNSKERHDILCDYDKEKYKLIWRKRWDPFDNKPIEEPGKLCYLLRRVTNEDPDRVKRLVDLLRINSKVIIFYNFTSELNILRSVANKLNIPIGELNGEKHTDIPKTDRWVYLVQYAAGSDAWNCTETNAMIFYSLNYSYKTMVQASGRIDRLNTPFDTLYYYIFHSLSPIDISIMRALKQKKKFNEKNFLLSGGYT